MELFINTLVYKPGIVAETVLPSITSSHLSLVSLQFLAEGGDHLEFDYPAWAAVENHLCQLAKRFSAKNPGKKMSVGILGNWCLGESQASDPMEHPIWKEVFSRLREEAIMYFEPVLHTFDSSE